MKPGRYLVRVYGHPETVCVVEDERGLVVEYEDAPGLWDFIGDLSPPSFVFVRELAADSTEP